jgi:DNA-binding NtrC family response regulator
MGGSSHIERPDGAPLRVVALATSEELRARLRTALPERAEVHFCRTARQLAASASAEQPGIVVIELPPGDGDSMAPSVRWLRAIFPTVPIIICCALSSATAHDILILAKAGVTGLALRGFDDLGATIQTAVKNAMAEGVANTVAAALDGVVPAGARAIVEYCIANARSAPSVTAVAAALGMPRKTLARHLVRAGLPAPSRLIA